MCAGDAEDEEPLMVHISRYNENDCNMLLLLMEYGTMLVNNI